MPDKHRRPLVRASDLAFAFAPSQTPVPLSATPRPTRTIQPPLAPATPAPAPTPVLALAPSAPLPASDLRPESSTSASAALVTPQRRVLRASDFSPFALSPSLHLESEKKPTYAVLTEIDPARRVRETPRPKADEGVKLSALPSVGEVQAMKRLRGEDEGIGVSPRKKVPSRYTGLQPSAELANIISGANTNLLLFYSSLSQALKKTGVSPLQHIRATATMRVVLVDCLSGPTHASTMMHCRVIRPGQARPALSVPGKAAGYDDPEHILVAFSPPPNDASRLGTDPRAAATSDRRYEAGIWAPASEVTVGGRRVVFASRYLVAQADA